MTKIQLRRGTSAQWSAANPVLSSGEQGFETDTGRFKVGDGASRWAALPYYLNQPQVEAVVTAALDASQALSSPDVSSVRVLTQQQYSQLDPDPRVLYLIVDADEAE